VNRSLQALVLGIGIFALDQATKQLALRDLAYGHPYCVIPGFFNLTFVRNTGAAWGILPNQGFWLTCLAVAALVVLLIARRHFTYVGRLPRIALGLLLGGIAGNLTDRLLYGHVIDFLDFYVNGWHWPAFNVADSSICVGVGLYLLDSLRREREVKTS
jgi:signal peptidase II